MAPKEYDCHIRQRLDALVPRVGQAFELLNFDKPMPEEMRTKEIRNLVETLALPWLERKCDLNEMRTFFLKEKDHGLPVANAVYGFLGITKEEAEQSLRLVRKKAAQTRLSRAGQG